MVLMFKYLLIVSFCHCYMYTFRFITYLVNMPSLSESCVVCKSSTLVGDVSIGPNTILHPFVRIIARSGPIVIGEHNIIEENVEIINDAEEDSVMIIGSNNHIEVGARIRSLKVGNNNIIGSNTFLDQHVTLSYGCVVTPGISINQKMHLPLKSLIKYFGRKRMKYF